MQAAVVGMANAIGQMFNAFKEQTPLVVYSYRTDQTRRAGRDGFEEVANQEQIVQPITKYSWLARRQDMIPETIRRGFKAAWTPPYGPAYISWPSDYNDERVVTEIIAQALVDPRMRVRPNPDEVTRAAKLLVEARMPLMVVGDEIYKAKALPKAVRLAELLGMPVTQVRQLYANFPETHPLWVGNLAGSSLNSLNYPKSADVIINVGNKFQHNGAAPIVPRGPKFIDMRIDYGSMGNVMLTEVPLVCDVGYGLDDLIAAVDQLMTPALQRKAPSVRSTCASSANGRGGRARSSPTIPTGTRRRSSPTASPGRWRNSPIPTPSSCTRRARWRCTPSTSIRSAGASCSSIMARISARVSARRRAGRSRGRTSRGSVGAAAAPAS